MSKKRHTCCSRRNTLYSIVFLFSLILSLTSCNEAFPDLDEDGGYINPKTGKYQYVFPSKKGVDMDPQNIKKPRAGETQEIMGVISKITDTQSIWVRIPDRQTYMILAQGASKSNRNDKQKELRFILKYVNPEIMRFPTPEFRKQWLNYIRQTMERELLAKAAAIRFQHEGAAFQFRAVVNLKGKTDQAKNVNLWMVKQGLTYYVIQHGRSPRDKTFKQAEAIARKAKTGLWKY